MKKCCLFLCILLLFLASCSGHKENPENGADDQNTPIPSGLDQDAAQGDSPHTISPENSLHLNIQEEMQNIVLENGRYHLSAMISEVVSGFTAKIIKQDETYTILQLDSAYADQKFRIPGGTEIRMQAIETNCLQYYNKLKDPPNLYKLEDPPNLYKLQITVGIQTENGMHKIGEITVDLNDYEKRLHSAYALFTPDASYQMITYMSFEQTLQNFQYTEDECTFHICTLHYTGVPGEYYVSRYEEMHLDLEDEKYAPQPTGVEEVDTLFEYSTALYEEKEEAVYLVDIGQAYTLSDDCEIFGMLADFGKKAFPESIYPYQYHLISEKQLRTAAVNGFLTPLYGCYIKGDEIMRIVALSAP